MKRHLIVAALLVLGVSPLFARIGETIEQADARYGVPVSMKADGYGGFPERTYRKGDVEILTHFMDGKIECIEFKKIDGSDIDADEFKALARAQGLVIPEKALFGSKENWIVNAPITEKNQHTPYQATYGRESKILTVFTQAYMGRAAELEEVRKRKATEEKLKGF